MPATLLFILLFIEDCAQSHGATINKQKAGTFSDISTYSLFPVLGIIDAEAT